ncbi:Tat pathway signal sequence [Actinomyces sp. 2119]|uniref:Tat pathway signal sequence n=2 Tax=Actinomycetaceae TaxID=2049 RepID=A0ABN5PUM8_9ACTO|nr:Tat pathway signal sequence [Actinomyces lilanjuaniae]RJF43287.1 Tat pathway signal sequence [Actinomyces sp. 2119]
MTRRTALGLAGLGTLPALLPSRATAAGPGPTAGGRVVLHVTDGTGAALDLKGVRAVQSNGVGEDGYDDVLLDASTLTVVTPWPLQEAAGTGVCLDLPAGGPYVLSLSWPTSHGYSALMADLPGPGEYDLLELAASSLHGRQEAGVAALGVEASAGLLASRARAQEALEACGSAVSWTQRGTWSRMALEAASSAQFLLDQELAARGPQDAVVGVTLTRPPSQVELASLVGPQGPTGGVRRLAARMVVLDPSDPVETAGWKEVVAELHRHGALAVGQVCDSQLMGSVDGDAWKERVDALLDALPGTDVWEVGNELGGDWLGDSAVSRTTYAARQVRDRTGAQTLLTLYYQLGQGSPEGSVFTFLADQVGEDLRDLVDVVGLSVYPQLHPLGTAADRVLATLEQAWPAAQVALTELGYGGADLDDGPWWFGSSSNLAAAREAVITHATSAAMGRETAWGAPFWWYYLEDEAGMGVAEAIAEAARGTTA